VVGAKTSVRQGLLQQSLLFKVQAKPLKQLLMSATQRK
jgi:hypothetical protein